MPQRSKVPKKQAETQQQAAAQTTAPQQPTLWTKARPVLVAGYFLTLAAISSTLSQLVLAPVYGSIPSAAYHQPIRTSLLFLAFMLGTALKNFISLDLSWYLPIISFCVPALQHTLLLYSTHLGIELGPLVTETLTYFPLLFISAYVAARHMDTGNVERMLVPAVAGVVPAAAAFGYLTYVAQLTSEVIPRFASASNFLSRTNLQLVVASLYTLYVPSKSTMLAIPAIFHTMFLNPHYVSPHTTEALNRTLHSHGWNLLERKESVTGYISVLENLELDYRVMRCDHSLLGGEWLVTEQRKKEGITVAEPIYAVFEMLEAVRLIEVPESRHDENALVIGLGIGTAPKALLAHNIATTTVEIDPVVHDFATRYFSLPPHNAVIANALTFVNDSARAASDQYTYIIHDVFTGGAEPLSLFTTAFLSNLRALLAPNGAIAINYAGDLTAPATKQVLNTIGTVFDHRCRIFRDAPKEQKKSSSTSTPTNDEDDDNEGDFINMVIFCHPSSTTPLTFRQPIEADFLSSQSRRHFLLPRPELELRFPTKKQTEGMELLTEENVGDFEARQLESAKRHWRIMRRVLPAAVWENW